MHSKPIRRLKCHVKPHREVAGGWTKLCEIRRLSWIAQLYRHNESSHTSHLHANNGFFKGRDDLQPGCSQAEVMQKCSFTTCAMQTSSKTCRHKGMAIPVIPVHACCYWSCMAAHARPMTIMGVGMGTFCSPTLNLKKSFSSPTNAPPLVCKEAKHAWRYDAKARLAEKLASKSCGGKCLFTPCCVLQMDGHNSQWCTRPSQW